MQKKELPIVTIPKKGMTVKASFTVSRLICGMGCGIYGADFYDNTSGIFPEYMLDRYLPEGTVVEVSVKVVKVGKKIPVNPWEARNLYGYEGTLPKPRFRVA